MAAKVASKLPSILLDTNVLSELMRAEPDAGVMAWFERRAGKVFHISAITRAEILLGIALLPTGKRRDGLARAAEQMFAQDFAGGCLPFDSAAAPEYALIVATRTRAGKPVSTEDAQIAAIALARKMLLATRNTKDYEGIDGLDLENPWQAA
jgi:toxin FitB